VDRRGETRVRSGEKDLDSERTGLSSGPQPLAETPEDLAQLPVDEIVRRLIPDTPEEPARLISSTATVEAAEHAAAAGRRVRNPGRARTSELV
jgi:hypothetical protein